MQEKITNWLTDEKHLFNKKKPELGINLTDIRATVDYEFELDGQKHTYYDCSFWVIEFSKHNYLDYDDIAQLGSIISSEYPDSEINWSSTKHCVNEIRCLITKYN